MGIKQHNYYQLIIIVISIFSRIQPLYATSTDSADSLKNIAIELHINQEEFVKGKLFDIYVRIKNTGKEKIILPQYGLNVNVLNQESNKLFSYNLTLGQFSILPDQERILIDSPIKHYHYLYNEGMSKDFMPWFHWNEGNYSLYVEAKVGGDITISNTIKFSIIPIPENYLEAFNALGMDLTKKDKIDQSNLMIKESDFFLESNKNLFFEKEFYNKLFLNQNYLLALENVEAASVLRDRAVRIAIEYITKYPNSRLTTTIFKYIYKGGHSNQKLLEEVLDILKLNYLEDGKVKKNTVLEIIVTEPSYKQIQLLNH